MKDNPRLHFSWFLDSHSMAGAGAARVCKKAASRVHKHEGLLPCSLTDVQPHDPALSTPTVSIPSSPHTLLPGIGSSHLPQFPSTNRVYHFSTPGNPRDTLQLRCHLFQVTTGHLHLPNSHSLGAPDFVVCIYSKTTSLVLE